MKKIFLVFLCAIPFSFAQQNSSIPGEENLSGKSVDINFSNEKVTMTLKILKSKTNSTPEEIYFAGVSPCPATTSSTLKLGQVQNCLKFRTQFPETPWEFVPVQLINAFKEKSMSPDLEHIYSSGKDLFIQSKTESFLWGKVYNWSTLTFGSAHYLYLKPKNKNYAIRIGPFAGMVLSKHDLNLKKIIWK